MDKKLTPLATNVAATIASDRLTLATVERALGKLAPFSGAQRRAVVAELKSSSEAREFALGALLELLGSFQEKAGGEIRALGRGKKTLSAGAWRDRVARLAVGSGHATNAASLMLLGSVLAEQAKVLRFALPGQPEGDILGHLVGALADAGLTTQQATLVLSSATTLPAEEVAALLSGGDVKGAADRPLSEQADRVQDLGALLAAALEHRARGLAGEAAVPQSAPRVAGEAAPKLRAEPLSEAAALEALQAAIGKPVALTSLLGDRIEGTLERVGGGVATVLDDTNTIGLPRYWPIDSIATFAIDGGNPRGVDHLRNDDDGRDAFTGMRRSPEAATQALHLALGVVESANAAHRPVAADARDAIMRSIEELSSPWAIQYALLLGLESWGTFTSRATAIDVSQKSDKYLAAAKVAGDLFPGRPAEARAAIEELRLRYLADVEASIDMRIKYIASENEYLKTPEGKAMSKALHERMLALNAQADQSRQEWQNEQDHRTARRLVGAHGDWFKHGTTIPDPTPSCGGDCSIP